MNHEELRRRRELFRSLIDNIKLAMNRGDWKVVGWWLSHANEVYNSMKEAQNEQEGK